MTINVQRISQKRSGFWIVFTASLTPTPLPLRGRGAFNPLSTSSLVEEDSQVMRGASEGLSKTEVKNDQAFG